MCYFIFHLQGAWIISSSLTIFASVYLILFPWQLKLTCILLGLCRWRFSSLFFFRVCRRFTLKQTLFYQLPEPFVNVCTPCIIQPHFLISCRELYSLRSDRVRFFFFFFLNKKGANRWLFYFCSVDHNHNTHNPMLLFTPEASGGKSPL